MGIEHLKKRIPDYAKDLRLNLGSLPDTQGMTSSQLWGSALAAALASRNPEVVAALETEASVHLDAKALDAVRSAAAIMAMNNVYYRFIHLCSSDEYRQMPARLRMQVISNPGVDRADFELWSLAVSAVNGCGLCIDAHERELRKRAVGPEVIQNAARIAAIVHAVSVTLDDSAAGQVAPAAA